MDTLTVKVTITDDTYASETLVHIQLDVPTDLGEMERIAIATKIESSALKHLAEWSLLTGINGVETIREQEDDLKLTDEQKKVVVAALREAGVNLDD